MGAYENLPPACRVGPQADLWRGLTAGFDRQIEIWTDRITDYRTIVDPARAPDESLDWLASLTPWRGLWNGDWAPVTKRALLGNVVEIFRDRYKPSLLPKMFAWFGLAGVRLEPTGGWVIGVTNLPATPGLTLTSYRIIAPAHYQVGTAARSTLDFIVTNFGMPVQIEIVLS